MGRIAQLFNQTIELKMNMTPFDDFLCNKKIAKLNNENFFACVSPAI